MKILHISTQATGGAGRSCVRLHEGLLAQGIDSNLLLLYAPPKGLKNAYKYTLPLAGKWEKLKSKTKRILREFRLYPQDDKDNKSKFLQNRPKGLEVFSFPDTPFDITQHPLYKEADIINLHWVAGFLDYPSFFKNNTKKIVWTLHDMNPFTGGCHYAGDCKGFENTCNNCPQLLNTIDPDHSNKILQSKSVAISGNCNLSLIFPSQWLLEQSKKSVLFNKYPHVKIPYGLNEAVFKPLSQKFSRELLGLPQDKKVVLFVSDLISHKRKGYDYLVEAIGQLENREDIVLCTVGGIGAGKIEKSNLFELGFIADERLMSAAYAAADLFVIPSLEDNLPNTVLESLLCGTPVIGFPIGGVVDMIMPDKNGYICENVSSRELAANIIKMLSNSAIFNREEIRSDAERKYSLNVQATAYMALYKKISGQ